MGFSSRIEFCSKKNFKKSKEIIELKYRLLLFFLITKESLIWQSRNKKFQYRVFDFFKINYIMLTNPSIFPYSNRFKYTLKIQITSSY